MGSDIQYVAELDGSQIAAELDKINKKFKKTQVAGDKAFKKIGASVGASSGVYRDAEGRLRGLDGRFVAAGKSSKTLGLLMGVTAGIVSVLTEKFLELGAAAISQLTEITKESVNLASQLESARVTFTNIFEGDAGASEAFLQRLNQQALELGVNFSDLSGFAKSILPDTSSIDQFDRLTKAAVTLEKSDPDKTLDDVRIALEQALSRDFISLQDRFDLPKSSIARIKELQNELGPIEGLIQGLNEEFERTGQSIESFEDTFASTKSRVEAQFNTLQTLFGEPILEELKDEFSTFEDFLSQNQETLTLVAQAFGDVIAAAVNFVGSGLNDYLSDSDPSSLLETADTLHDLVQIGGTFLSLAFEWVGVLFEFFDAIRFTDDALGEATENMGGMSEIMLFLLDLLAQSTAGWRGLIAVIEPTTSAISKIAEGMADLAAGDFEGALVKQAEAAKILEDGLLDVEAGQQAANASYAESTRQIEDLRQALQDNNRAMDERRDKLNQDTSAQEANADAILKAAAAEKEAAEARKRAEEIQGKLTDETEKLTEKLIEIDEKGAQKRLDQLIKNAQQREDIARKNARRLEDIERKHSQDVSDAQRDIGRGGADLARKQAREQLALERSLNDEKIGIEENFRQKLQDIRTRFAQAAEEAERSRDAIGFLRAQRQRDQDIQSAQQDKQSETQAAVQEAERQRQELRIRQQQEVEDAKIANERKLEDLRLALERRLEENRITNERELEDQAIKEERELQQANMQHTRLIQAARQATAEKLADLTGKLSQEIQAVARAEARKTALVKQSVSQQQAAYNSLNVPGNKDLGISGGTKFPKKAFGGAVVAGQSVIVGDRGGLSTAEVFTPAVSGSLTPVSRLPLLPSGGNTSIDNSIQAEVNQSLLDPSKQSAIMRQIARAEAQKTLNEIFRNRSR